MGPLPSFHQIRLPLLQLCFGLTQQFPLFLYPSVQFLELLVLLGMNGLKGGQLRLRLLQLLCRLLLLCRPLTLRLFQLLFELIPLHFHLLNPNLQFLLQGLHLDMPLGQLGF